MSGITIIQAPRQGGKTHVLVEWVKAGPGRVIITADEREAQRLRRDYRLTSAQVLSSHAHRQLAGYEPLSNRVAVDNLDLWLRSHFGQVEMVSLTDPVIVTRPEQAQHVEWVEPEWSRPDALLEDEDGAPYPEHVQEVVRDLRIKIEKLQYELAETKARAARDEQGLIAMMAATVAPKVSAPIPDLQPCRECREGKHGNCDRTTWDEALDCSAECPCAKMGHGSSGG